MDEKVQNPQEEILSPPQGGLEENAKFAQADSLDALKQLLGVEKDKYLRLMAEFDNMRKRHQRDREELIKYAHEEVIIECLKLYDDLERSLNAFKAKEGIDANLVKGLEMVFNSMRELMTKYDVKPVESVGKPFNPNAQEVLMQQETSDAPDGTVIEEFEKGYTLGGRVVRTAKVKVAKNS